MSNRKKVSADRRIRQRYSEPSAERAGRLRKDLRDLPSHRFKESAVTAEFSQFFESTILPRLQLRGYKLAEKRRIAAQIIHKLLAAGFKEAVVSDRRRNDNPGAERRKAIWDAVIAAGFAIRCLGSQSSGRQTVYRATTELLSLRKEWPLRLL